MTVRIQWCETVVAPTSLAICCLPPVLEIKDESWLKSALSLSLESSFLCPSHFPLQHTYRTGQSSLMGKCFRSNIHYIWDTGWHPFQRFLLLGLFTLSPTLFTSSHVCSSSDYQTVRQANNSNEACSAAWSIGKGFWNDACPCAANGIHHRPQSPSFCCSSWWGSPTQESPHWDLVTLRISFSNHVLQCIYILKNGF